MTDKEMLLYLFSKLKLKLKEVEAFYIDDDEFTIDNKRNTVILCVGEGYSTCHIRFQFDDQDNLISHEVWE